MYRNIKGEVHTFRIRRQINLGFNEPDNKHSKRTASKKQRYLLPKTIEPKTILRVKKMQEDIEIDFASVQRHFIKIEEEFSNFEGEDLLTLVLEGATYKGA